MRVFEIKAGNETETDRVCDLAEALVRFARREMSRDPRYMDMSVSELLSAVTLLLVSIASRVVPLDVAQSLFAALWSRTVTPTPTSDCD